MRRCLKSRLPVYDSGLEQTFAVLPEQIGFIGQLDSLQPDIFLSIAVISRAKILTSKFL